HGDFAGGGDGPEFILFVGAGDQVAVVIEVHAIGTAGRLQEYRDDTIGGIPFHDAVVGLVGEIDVTTAVHRGTFGEGEFAGDLLHRGTGRQQRALGAADKTAGEQTAH